MPKTISLLYVLILVSVTSIAQSNLTALPAIINEIGFMKGSDQEFIELVISQENVNLAQWTLDNFLDPAQPDQGYIGFAIDFPSLPIGTPILIYNNQSPPSGILSTQDGALTSDGFFQIPFSSNLLTKYASSGAVLSNGNSMLWKDFMSFDQLENGLSLRDPAGNTRIAHTWGYQGTSSPGFIATAIPGGITPNTQALVFG